MNRAPTEGGAGRYNPPLLEVDGLGETMVELAVPRGNFARRALLKLPPLGAIIIREDLESAK